jgi:hypothetical protein
MFPRFCNLKFNFFLTFVFFYKKSVIYNCSGNKTKDEDINIGIKPTCKSFLFNTFCKPIGTYGIVHNLLDIPVLFIFLT